MQGNLGVHSQSVGNNDERRVFSYMATAELATTGSALHILLTVTAAGR